MPSVSRKFVTTPIVTSPLEGRIGQRRLRVAATQATTTATSTAARQAYTITSAADIVFPRARWSTLPKNVGFLLSHALEHAASRRSDVQGRLLATCSALGSLSLASADFS